MSRPPPPGGPLAAGLIDTLWRHRGYRPPRYGIVGMVALPGFALFEMLSPVIELSGYVMLPLLCLSGTSTRRTLLVSDSLPGLRDPGIDTGGGARGHGFRRYPRVRDGPSCWPRGPGKPRVPAAPSVAGPRILGVLAGRPFLGALWSGGG